MLLFFIHANAARRFETPRGIVFCDRYKNGIGDDKWTYGIPVDYMVVISYKDRNKGVWETLMITHSYRNYQVVYPDVHYIYRNHQLLSKIDFVRA